MTTGAVAQNSPVIAIEEHWTFPPLIKALEELPPERVDPSLVLNNYGGAGLKLDDLGEARLADMDAQGVDVQVLALAPPGSQGLAAADAVVVSREANDVVAEAGRAHPDRFRALASLPLADPLAAAVELERAANQGLVGTMVYGRDGDTALDDPRFEDLWTVAAEMHLPVFIHPQVPSASVRGAAFSGLGDAIDLALSTYGWGRHLEAGTSALRLMARGVLDRHPSLQLVLGHWGELLLFWHQRADGVARAAGLQRSISEYLQQNVWITASGMLDSAQLQHALAVTSLDRILSPPTTLSGRPTGPT